MPSEEVLMPDKRPEMMVNLTVEDLNRLWRATVDEAKLWREMAEGYPLRTQNANTKRDDMMESASEMAQRARYFKGLADKLEAQYTEQLNQRRANA